MQRLKKTLKSFDNSDIPNLVKSSDLSTKGSNYQEELKAEQNKIVKHKVFDSVMVYKIIKIKRIFG